MDVFDPADLLAIAEDEDSEDEGGAESLESDDERGESYNAGGHRAEPEARAEKRRPSCSDDDDDGFLESWFKEDSPRIVGPSKSTTSNASDNDDCEQAKIDPGVTEVKLGSSVSNWIERYNEGNSEEARVLTGVVGVQAHNNTWSELKMILGSDSKGGRKRAVQLEDSAGSKYTCEADISSKFVDCLARYDEVKGAYILETVDWKLSNLKQTDSRKRTAPSSAPTKPQGILDPRTRAKKAEESLKRLKRSSRPKPPTRKASTPTMCPPNNQKTNDDSIK